MTRAKKSRHKSKQNWLNEHRNDPYVKQAQQEGYRSRAVYKLKEMNEKDHLLKPGMTVVDLGAAPGSWSAFAATKVGANGKVIAMDILPIEPIPGVVIIQGDFQQQMAYEQLLESLSGNPVDLVMSDMAPNISGVKAVDQPRAMALSELALELAQETLIQGGSMLVKGFQGEGLDVFTNDLRRVFNQVFIRKPKASRTRSAEVYLLARGYKL